MGWEQRTLNGVRQQQMNSEEKLWSRGFQCLPDRQVRVCCPCHNSRWPRPPRTPAPAQQPCQQRHTRRAARGSLSCAGFAWHPLELAVIYRLDGLHPLAQTVCQAQPRAPGRKRHGRARAARRQATVC